MIPPLRKTTDPKIVSLHLRVFDLPHSGLPSLSARWAFGPFSEVCALKHKPPLTLPLGPQMAGTVQAVSLLGLANL